MDNNLITTINDKLFYLNEKKKNYRKKEIQLKAEVKVQESAYNKFEEKNKNAIKVFIFFLIITLVCGYQISKYGLTLPIQVIPRTVFPLFGVLGSINYWMINSNKTDEIFSELCDTQEKLEHVQNNIKGIQEINSLAHEMIMSSNNGNRLEDINKMLDECVYLKNAKSSTTIEKPKARILNNSNKH